MARGIDNTPPNVRKLRSAILDDRVLAMKLFGGEVRRKDKIRLRKIVDKLDSSILFDPRYTQAMQAECVDLREIVHVIEQILFEINEAYMVEVAAAQRPGLMGRVFCRGTPPTTLNL